MAFLRSIEADIQRLRDILGEQYDVHSILRELIQNADDAAAGSFELGWIKGLGNRHPLLSGPALLVLNDGKFERQHEKDIQTLGFGSKTVDEGVIGKFGLGLKSIFHVCEAFFFIASHSQPASDGRPLSKILNPWYDSQEQEGDHGDWDRFDPKEVLARLERLRMPYERWFCLWIPLRTVRQSDTPLRAEFPGDLPSPPKALFAKDLDRQLTDLMPLLRHLHTIKVWAENGTSGIDEWLRLTVDPTAKRLKATKLPLGERMELSGTITCSGRTASGLPNFFFGQEVRLNDDGLSVLKSRPDWPLTSTKDPESKRARQEKEKAVPHAAVTFSRRATLVKGRGRLNLSWAVFLPLPEEQYEFECGGDYDYQVSMHGYYFVDSGRKRLHEQRDDDLKTTWNRLLKQRGTLRLVLPALDGFVRAASLPIGETRELTEGLRQLLQPDGPDGASLCAEHQWLYRVEAENPAWQLIGAGDAFRVIPEPSTPNLEFEVLPDLASACTSAAVTYSSWPRLARGTPGTWVAHLPRLLATLPVSNVFGSANKLAFLNKFIDQEKGSLDAAGLAELVRLAKIAIRELGVGRIRANKLEFQHLMRNLPAGICVPFPCKDGLLKPPDGDAGFDRLTQLGLSPLIVPSDLAPAELQYGKLGIDDAARIIASLVTDGNLSGNDAITARSTLVLNILELTEGSRAERRSKCGNHPLFRCYSYAAKKEALQSWNDLERLRATGSLFVGASDLPEPLQESLASHELFRLVDADGLAQRVLFGENTLRTCNQQTCINLLLQSPRLAAPERRKRLLAKIINRTADTPAREHKQAVRYLLHGVSAQAPDVETPMFMADPETTGVWSKLGNQALQRLNVLWRWVPVALANHLSPEDARSVNVRSLSQARTEELLAEAGCDWVTAHILTSEERIQVLAETRDTLLWKQFALHQTAAGEFVTIKDGQTYLAGDSAKVPPVLTGIVTILRRPKAEALRLVYERSVPVWCPEAAIRIVLAQANPEQFVEVVLDSLAATKEDTALPSDMVLQIRVIRWLPTLYGPKAPADVICLPGLEDELARLLNDPSVANSFVDIRSLSENVQKHQALNWLKKHVFPARADALEALGKCLALQPKHLLGKLQSLQTELDLELFLDAVSRAPVELLPVVPVLKAAITAFGGCACKQHLLPHLLQDIEEARIIACLRFLETEHTNAAGSERKKCVTVYSWYLALWVGLAGFDATRLKGMRLLNRLGRWQDTARLALDAPGIHDDALLDIEQGNVVRQKISQLPSPASSAPAAVSTVAPAGFDDGAPRLIEFFRRWEGHVPRPVIGGFLALLGDHPDLKRAAADYLAPFSLETTRNSITVWEKPGVDTVIPDRMGKHRFAVEIHPIDRKAVSVVSLVGTAFDADRSADVQTLLLGNPEHQGGPYYKLRLRTIEPYRYSAETLTAILSGTIRIIVGRVCWLEPKNLAEYWKNLGLSSQLELRVAQDLILENAFFYFGQIGGGKSEEIRRLYKQWEDLRHRKAEQKNALASGRGDKGLTQDEDAVKKELRHKLENDHEFQMEVLSGVRNKVQQYQYHPDSILFELFQNADDAVVELDSMAHDGTVPRQCERFVVAWDARRLYLMHWGRLINQFCLGAYTPEEGRRRGFNRDLEKMLVLSSSDKSENAGITGRFGLGFKSVFLFTDRPNVLSGQLGVAVVGGLFPQCLSPDARHRLSGYLRAECGDQDVEGTVFELAVRDTGAGNAKPEEVTHRFSLLAHILLPFARRIRQCVLKPGGGITESIRWDERLLSGTNHIWIGSLTPSSVARAAGHSPALALVLQAS